MYMCIVWQRRRRIKNGPFSFLLAQPRDGSVAKQVWGNAVGNNRNYCNNRHSHRWPPIAASSGLCVYLIPAMARRDLKRGTIWVLCAQFFCTYSYAAGLFWG